MLCMPRPRATSQFPTYVEIVEKPLIVGLGNLLRGDEGLGVHAAQRLSSALNHLEAVDVIDGGTLGLSLIDPIAEASALILIDAVNLRAESGTTEVFVGEGMDRFIVNLKTRTAHDVNLVDLTHALRLMGSLPQARALIAIQPHTLQWTTDLTPSVDAALGTLPVLCERLLTFLAQPSAAPAPDWHVR